MLASHNGLAEDTSLLEWYAVSTSKYLTDIAKERSAFIVRVKQSSD